MKTNKYSFAIVYTVCVYTKQKYPKQYLTLVLVMNYDIKKSF